MANILNFLDSDKATSRFPTETSLALATTADISEDQFFRGFDGQSLVTAAGPA
jgi:hypothetical protein